MDINQLRNKLDIEKAKDKLKEKIEEKRRVSILRPITDRIPNMFFK